MAHQADQGVLVDEAKVRRREHQIRQALAQAEVLHDAACIEALRRMVETVTRYNEATGWLLDRPSGTPQVQ